MRFGRVPLAGFVALGLSALVLGGCGSAVIGGAATVGLHAAQDRSLGDAVDDAGILLEVNQQLLQTSEILFRKVDVDVVEGRVLMTGSVPKPDDRITASRIAWKAKGVKEVLNELQVQDTSTLSDYARDTWIATRLRGAILGDSRIFDINYNIDVVNGVVYLFGIARTREELDALISHARTVKGVKKVVSHVTVRSPEKPAS